jgi:hypothetical protein
MIISNSVVGLRKNRRSGVKDAPEGKLTLFYNKPAKAAARPAAAIPPRFGAAA